MKLDVGHCINIKRRSRVTNAEKACAHWQCGTQEKVINESIESILRQAKKDIEAIALIVGRDE